MKQQETAKTVAKPVTQPRREFSDDDSSNAEDFIGFSDQEGDTSRQKKSKGVTRLSQLTNSADIRRDIRSAIQRINIDRWVTVEKGWVLKGLLILMLGDVDKIVREKFNTKLANIHYNRILSNNVKRGIEYMEEPPYLVERKEGGSGPWREMCRWLLSVSLTTEVSIDTMLMMPQRDNEATRENTYKYHYIKLHREHPHADKYELQQRFWAMVKKKTAAVLVNE